MQYAGDFVSVTSAAAVTLVPRTFSASAMESSEQARLSPAKELRAAPAPDASTVAGRPPIALSAVNVSPSNASLRPATPCPKSLRDLVLIRAHRNQCAASTRPVPETRAIGVPSLSVFGWPTGGNPSRLDGFWTAERGGWLEAVLRRASERAPPIGLRTSLPRVGYRQPSPSLGPPLLSLSLSPPPWGMLVPAGHPSAFWDGVAGAVVDGVGGFDGVFDEPHPVSVPTVMIAQTRSMTSDRMKRIVTRFLSLAFNESVGGTAPRGRRFSRASPPGLGVAAEKCTCGGDEPRRVESAARVGE